MKTKEMQDGTHKRNQEDDWEAEILDTLDETMNQAFPIPQSLFEKAKHIREIAEINKKRDASRANPVDGDYETQLNNAFAIAFERYESALEELAKK